MLHKLPVVLRPNILFPWSNRRDDRSHVLPAFLKLVHLFWVFDQSGIFEILRNADADVSSMESLARGCLELLQTKLQDTDGDEESLRGLGDLGGLGGNEVQRADMLVTRQWMRAVLWRAALRFGVVVPAMNPVDVAGEFLSLVAQLPMAALESQGPTLVSGHFFLALLGLVLTCSRSSRHMRLLQPLSMRWQILTPQQQCATSQRRSSPAYTVSSPPLGVETNDCSQC